jgi:hypothetical protein
LFLPQETACAGHLEHIEYINFDIIKPGYKKVTRSAAILTGHGSLNPPLFGQALQAALA